MKREDAAIIIRAIGIGLFSILIIVLSTMFVAFVLYARRISAEVLS